jgi:hypothetical protein
VYGRDGIYNLRPTQRPDDPWKHKRTIDMGSEPLQQVRVLFPNADANKRGGFTWCGRVLERGGFYHLVQDMQIVAVHQLETLVKIWIPRQVQVRVRVPV